MNDAKFEDGADRPLRLWAQDSEDLQVISTLTQDAVFPGNEMSWMPARRTFAVLLNRFRWEDVPAATARKREFERVQAVLEINDVMSVRSQGVAKGDADTILSLLSIEWQPGDDGAGLVTLTLAGDGAIQMDVECIDVRLTDVTRPYLAPSRQAPGHDLS